MIDDDLERVSPSQFQDMVQATRLQEVDERSRTFGLGPDGGKDMTLCGEKVGGRDIRQGLDAGNAAFRHRTLAEV